MTTRAFCKVWFMNLTELKASEMHYPCISHLLSESILLLNNYHSRAFTFSLRQWTFILSAQIICFLYYLKKRYLNRICYVYPCLVRCYLCLISNRLWEIKQLKRNRTFYEEFLLFGCTCYLLLVMKKRNTIYSKTVWIHKMALLG